MIGGPPCQGFSNLNRAGESVESRRRWKDYIRALDASSPRMFVMENVPQMLKSSEYPMFKAEARARGYVVEERILNAAQFGVPQRRRRAIVSLGRRAGVRCLGRASVPGASSTERARLRALGALVGALASRDRHSWPAEVRSWASDEPKPPDDLVRDRRRRSSSAAS